MFHGLALPQRCWSLGLHHPTAGDAPKTTFDPKRRLQAENRQESAQKELGVGPGSVLSAGTDPVRINMDTKN